MIPYDIGALGRAQAEPDTQVATDWFSANAPQPQTGGITGGQPTGNGSGLSVDPSAPRPGSLEWVQQQLRAVNSTDDPQQWVKYLAADPKVAAGDQSAINYWIDRIRRGDGSELVRNGTLTRVGGAPGTSANIGAFGSLAEPWTREFKAPTIADLENPDSPQYAGYQFAKKEGINALDSAAAARGTLLNGGQKKDIMQFATGLANQYGQQAYQNALGEYAQAYDIFRSNGNDIFNRFNTLAGAGTSAAGAATS